MSGLVAFTGPPDRSLIDRMLGRLSHRGRPLGEPYQTTHGSMAVCEWPGFDPPGQTKTGVYEPTGSSAANPDALPAVWALSGFLFSSIPDQPNESNVRSMRGSFGAACLADDCLIIARDAHGCQSLYYGRVGQRWLVATEPKAITAERDFQRTIRPAALAQYLSFSFVPGQGTMFEDLYEAEAGHLIELRHRESPRINRTFRFEDHEFDDLVADAASDRDATFQSDEQCWIDRTKQAIEVSVNERLGNQRPIVFLSGGLDSSLIAAEVARQASQPIRTLSIHFGPKYPHELNFAHEVAERIGSEHEDVLIQPQQFLPRLRQMIYHLDEPIGDPITQPNYELAAHVGGQGGFVFNGEGGDPVFGGPKNLPMLLMHWYGDADRSPNFRERAYLASYRRGYEGWSGLLSADVRHKIDPETDLEQVLKPFFEADRPKSFLNKLMAINIRLKGANLILPKVDRMLAAHGLTPLSPLFDDQLTRLSFQMPPRMKLRSGIEKYALKRAYQSLLPTSVIERPKSGMRVPVHYWFQGEMKAYAKSILSKRNVRRAGLFDPDRVQQLLHYESEEGPGRYGLRLWMLMTLEIWRRIFIEGESH